MNSIGHPSTSCHSAPCIKQAKGTHQLVKHARTVSAAVPLHTHTHTHTYVFCSSTRSLRVCSLLVLGCTAPSSSTSRHACDTARCHHSHVVLHTNRRHLHTNRHSSIHLHTHTRTHADPFTRTHTHIHTHTHSTVTATATTTATAPAPQTPATNLNLSGRPADDYATAASSPR
jgi:hypothetical protein